MGRGFQYPDGVHFDEPRLHRLPGIQTSSIEKYCHIVLGWGPRRVHPLRPFNDCLRALFDHTPIVGERELR